MGALVQEVTVFTSSDTNTSVHPHISEEAHYFACQQLTARVYSSNKKRDRNINNGLTDCRRTVVVMNFYKHLFRQVAELKESVLDIGQQKHSSEATG